MDDYVTIHFAVRIDGIREWEHVHIVGDLPILGNWEPVRSFPLTPADEDRTVWKGCIKVTRDTSDVHFRYLLVYFLDPAETIDASSPVLILSRWETFFSPRHCLLDVEAINGVARKDNIDEFGHYGGRQQISDGWILNDNESVVFFRIHGEALKLYNPNSQKKTLRVKVVPFDVRFRDKWSCIRIFPLVVPEKRVVMDERPKVDRIMMGTVELWRFSFVTTSVYQIEHSSDEHKDVDDNEAWKPPDLPSFSNTDLAVLTREDPIYGDQYINGSVFRNNVDYLVFRTRTVALHTLGLRIELFDEKKRYAIAYVLPTTFPETQTHGTAANVLVGVNQSPIGQIHVDYMIAKRCPAAKLVKGVDSMKKTYGRYWHRRARILEIGHRGMGSSYTKATSARENTVFSLNEAARRGADYVELDVQLTKDLKTVVFHDFHVLVHVAGRDSPGNSPVGKENNPLHQIAIKDLTLERLNQLHFEHISRAHNEAIENGGLSVTPAKDETNEEHVPFPSLSQVLRLVNKDVGLNIEIKYPMFMRDGSHECEGYFEQNKFVDIILSEVAQFAENRRIIFSCFEPDICTLIAQKQHKYPVLFLVVGATLRYMPFRDIRSDCSRIAANFAAGAQLLGVNFHSEELLNDRNPINVADKHGLVKFVWGDDLNSKDVQTLFKEEMNIDGIIFDRIGEDDVHKQNIFIVENEQKTSLFINNHSRSPSLSRKFISLDQQ